MPSALFHVDGSATVGAGHLMRCLALADALRAKDWDCTFHASAEAQELDVWTSRCSHTIQLAEAGAPVVLPEGRPYELLVFDSYRTTVEDERDLRGHAKRILVIDDLADRAHDCDIVLNQNLGRDSEDYRSLVPAACMVLAGPHYALIRDEFLGQRNRRHVPSNELPKRIFVSLGGGAASSELTTVLDGIAASRIDNPVVDVAPRNGQNDIAARMARADICITSGGITLLERCNIGVPGLAVVRAANQLPGVGEAVKAGAALGIGLDGAWDLTDVRDALDHLIAPGARSRMSVASAALCDGLGLRRLLLQITPEISTEGEAVTLRPATSRDVRTIYGWQCEVGARATSRNPAVPSWDEHIRWLTAKLASADTLLNVVLVDGRPAGVLRLDWLTADAVFEISILISDSFRRRGVALAALRATRRLVEDAPCRAFIKDENYASRRLFAKAGFRVDGQNWYRAEPLIGAIQ